MYYPENREKINIIEFKKFFESFKGLETIEVFEKFKKPEDFRHYQLGMLLLPNKFINIPTTDNKYNDYYLWKNNFMFTTVQYIDIILYKQGVSHYNIS
jgi:hypothetical protein